MDNKETNTPIIKATGKKSKTEPTYFAKSDIFSERTPQRQPQELGEVCVNIFEDK